ncbi:MAG TPA: hypothetical protein VFX97_10515 [Pyrinomonadaceae bacterium]|nr:hypothetical protein [Pyrinomonadaceae bacterium]
MVLQTKTALVVLSLFLLPLTIQGQDFDERRFERFRAATTVRIAVTQKLPEGANMNLPLVALAEEFLSAAGLKVVNREGPSDLTFTITVVGTAIGTRYYKAPLLPDSPYSLTRGTTGTVFYLSAEIDGKILLVPTGESQWSTIATYSTAFSGSTDAPPMRTSGGPTNPADAPFLDAFWYECSNAFPTQLLMMIGKVYGRKHVDAALHHSNERIRDCAKWALFKLYNEEMIVPGMEEKEVVRILGKPQAIVTTADRKKTILQYKGHVVEIEQGKVTAVKIR